MASDERVEAAARRAPVQASQQCRVCPRDMPRGTVSWAEHEEAAAAYNKHHSQSAAELARRGGFGYGELIEWLGREPSTWLPLEPDDRVTRAFAAGAGWATTRAADLEAENARLREEAAVYRDMVDSYDDSERYLGDALDAARRELAELRAGVEALAADDMSGLLNWQRDLLRTLLAAAPSEPVSEDDLTRRMRESIPSLRAAAALSLELGNFGAARELNDLASERERTLRGRVTEEGEG